jgi:Spy/CpxP family protein refolding chaperone
MSNRSVLSTIFGLFMGLVLTAAVATAGAQTPGAAPSNHDTQAQTAPGTQTAPPAGPSSNAAGSQNGTASQGSQGGSTTVEDELQLTPDQKQKIAAVVDDENKQIMAVRDDNSMTMQQKQQKVMQIRQEGSPKIKAVLTPEQLQKLAAIQQRAREQQGAGQSAPQSQTPPPQQTPPQTNPQH